jgi:Fibronectin type III domain
MASTRRRPRVMTALLAVAVLTVSYAVSRSQAVLAAAGSPDSTYNSLFNSYSNNATCADWSGGDATNSVQLPSGDRAWFFSDSFLGSPADRKTLFYSSGLHNSIVIQSGSILRTITGGNTCQERNQSLSFWSRYAITPAQAGDSSSGGFWWTGDQMVVGSNVVKFYYHGNHSVFPFAIDASGVAALPISQLEGSSVMTITPLRFTDLCASGPSTIIWGSSLLSWGGFVYVYGWSTTNRTLLYLARTTAANLTDPAAWQVFGGLSGGSPVWSTCGTPSPLPITLGSGLSVASINGSLWLIQMDHVSGLAAGPVTAHPASQPWLFGNSEVVLYYPPEGHHDYPDYFLGYEARLQPGLGSGSSVVVSYNVNSTAVDTGCVGAVMHDASIYRPRFIDVPTSAFSASAAVAAATSSGSTLAAPSYGIMDSGPTSSFAGPAVNAGGTVLDPAAASGGSIDGVSDWYDQWGSLNGGCPAIGAPSYLQAASPTPLGEVTLTWPKDGTDVWFYGYQSDQTASSGFSQMWGGLWVTPSLASTQVSQVAMPVTSAAVNGHTFAWYVQPFGAGDPPIIGPTTNRSPIASEPVSIQPPKAPTNLTGDHGSAAGEFQLSWTDVTYPSSAVYYWIYYWDVSAGQTESQATQSAVPAPPGTNYFDFLGLRGGDQYGFYVKAQNLGGFSPPSNAVGVRPTPVCALGVMPSGLDAGSAGSFKFSANQVIYLYVTDPSNLVDIVTGGAPTLTVSINGGAESQTQVLVPGAMETFKFSVFGQVPISYDMSWTQTSDAPLPYTVTSYSC